MVLRKDLMYLGPPRSAVNGGFYLFVSSNQSCGGNVVNVAELVQVAPYMWSVDLQCAADTLRHTMAAGRLIFLGAIYLVA